MARFRSIPEAGAFDFTVLNTHLDHVSESQRQLGASLVLARALFETAKVEGGGVVVTGDFNR